MSFLKPFLDAFKKASAPKDKSALEQVRDQAGLGVSADTDAFEPIPQPGGTPGGTANFIPNPQVPRDTEPIRRPPSKPTPPAEPGETGTFEGGDGGNTPTYPSAPFDPVTVKFPNTQAQGGGLPDAPDGGDKIAGLRRPPTGIKAEGVEPPLGSSDPEEGGEVSEAGKTDLDEGFIRRLRLVDDGSTVIEGGDTPEFTEYSGETTRQGTPLVQVGSGGDGSEGGGGSGPHPPGPGTGGSEGEPELISFVDRRGGATQPSNPSKVDTEHVGVSPVGAEMAPQKFEEVLVDRPPEPDSVQATELRRPPTGIKVEDAAPSLQSSDPEEGAEVTGLRRPPTGLKVEGVHDASGPAAGDQVVEAQTPAGVSGIPEGHTSGPGAGTRGIPEGHTPGPGAGTRGIPEGHVPGSDEGQIAERFRPPAGLKAEDVLPTLQSSDPEEGGEVAAAALRRPASGDDLFKVKLEDVLVSSPGAPAAPGGVPIPYPLAEGAPGDGGAGAEPLISGKMKVPHKIEGAIAPSSSEATVSDGDGSGVGGSLARKAGEGQKDFLKVEMKEAFIAREAPTGIDGESTHKDHKGEIEVLARRTGVTDAHDRLSATSPGAPATAAAPIMEDDDDLESSTLLDLKPNPAVEGMLPGLAGQVSGGPDLDADDVGADDDTDESEL